MRRWCTRRHGNYRSMAVHGNPAVPSSYSVAWSRGREAPYYLLVVFKGLRRDRMFRDGCLCTYDTYIRVRVQGGGMLINDADASAAGNRAY